MRLSEQLEQELYDAGLSKHRMELKGSIEGVLINKTIVTDAQLDPYRDNCVTCHELEHSTLEPKNLMFAPKALCDKVEAYVDRRTCEKLVCPDELIALYKKGITAPTDIADALEVDLKFFCHAIELYAGIYGTYVKDGYIIRFSPFRIKKCK